MQGLEQPSNSPGNRALSENAGTESGTVQDENSSLPPDLAMIISSWPHLTEDDRKAVLAIIREAAAKVRLMS